MKDPRIDDFLHFLHQAPTSWHAAEQASRAMSEHGFHELVEGTSWRVEPGKGYFVQREGSFFACVTPYEKPLSVVCAAAHSDSPALKLKPHAEQKEQNMTLLGVEVYGGPLLNSWLNRDLGIAGKVAYVDRSGALREELIYAADTPVVIPQLAIHLDREVNDKGVKLDRQKHLAALAAIDEEGAFLEPLIKRELPDCVDLLSYELFLLPIEPPRLIGNDRSLISAYRIDNLGGLHATLSGFLSNTSPLQSQLKAVLFWDHEEVGSETAQGAGSPFYEQTMERLTLNLGLSRDEQLQLTQNSFCLSVDGAHALHPNYTDRHEPNHQPLMGKGVTLKINAQQRYAGTAASSAWVAKSAEEAGLNLQKFVVRTDLPSGSTIGPIHSSRTGITTVDVGSPQLSMHAARELTSAHDHLALCSLTKQILAKPYSGGNKLFSRRPKELSLDSK